MSKEHRDLTRISHHTKIVATIGPASSDEETLEHMIRVGLNVVRFNFSHGDAAFHGENARKVREASRRVGREVAIVADLQGPKIRVGIIEGGKMELARGDKLILDAAYQGEGKNLRVGLDYRDLPKKSTPPCRTPPCSNPKKASTNKAAASPPRRSPKKTTRI